jgi:hypothetical protein
MCREKFVLHACIRRRVLGRDALYGLCLEISEKVSEENHPSVPNWQLHERVRGEEHIGQDLQSCNTSERPASVRRLNRFCNTPYEIATFVA